GIIVPAFRSGHYRGTTLGLFIEFRAQFEWASALLIGPPSADCPSCNLTSAASSASQTAARHHQRGRQRDRHSPSDPLTRISGRANDARPNPRRFPARAATRRRKALLLQLHIASLSRERVSSFTQA